MGLDIEGFEGNRLDRDRLERESLKGFVFVLAQPRKHLSFTMPHTVALLNYKRK